MLEFFSIGLPYDPVQTKALIFQLAQLLFFAVYGLCKEFERVDLIFDGLPDPKLLELLAGAENSSLLLVELLEFLEEGCPFDLYLGEPAYVAVLHIIYYAVGDSRQGQPHREPHFAGRSFLTQNLYCSVRYSNTEQHSRTHCGTTDAEIDENFSFRSDGSNWLTIQLRSRKDAESQSEDSGQDDRSYVVMCQVDEYIEEVEEDLKRTIKLEGSREYCNSGIVEYTINRGAKAPSIFEKQTQEEPERQHSST